jgi:hypothetical protein
MPEEERKFSPEEVTILITHERKIWKKDLNTTLAFRGFAAAVLGTIVNAFLITAGIDPNVALFSGAAGCAFMFYVADHTIGALLNWAQDKAIQDRQKDQ